MKMSESISELSKALAKFQEEVKQPFRDADNPFFKSKYVPLENVVESIHDIAPKHGISFTQYPLNDENGRVGVATLLMHESGEWIEFPPVFFEAEKQTPQGYGALITYIKRYSLSAIFGITSDQDDDANESSNLTSAPLASDKQLNYVTSLINNKYEKREERIAYFNDMIAKLQLNKDMTTWTSQQASAAIKYLQEG